MKISPVSFGQKAPISRCYIKDTKNDKFVPAIFYELDSKDSKDIELVRNLGNDMSYNKIVANKMSQKNDVLDSLGINHSRYFILENDNGEVVGLTQTTTTGQQEYIDYIESKKNSGYKYIGQSMIASLCSDNIKNDVYRISIPQPVKTAIKFYHDVCGFREYHLDGYLGMNTAQMNDFLEKYKQRTKHPILNLTV